MMRATGSRDRQGRWLVMGCLRNARPQQFTAEEVVRGFHALIEHLLRVRRSPLAAATSSRLHIHILLLPRDGGCWVIVVRCGGLAGGRAGCQTQPEVQARGISLVMDMGGASLDNLDSRA
eukprot:COSAG01_NODE_17208_length_1170_cov_0.998133_1_plen_120_part_10